LTPQEDREPDEFEIAAANKQADQDARISQRKVMSGFLEKQADLPVTIDGKDLPEPIASWEDGEKRGYLSAPVVDALRREGMEKPSKIQTYAIPIIAHNNRHFDLVAMATTGSGKTFAFVIPVVAGLLKQGIIARPYFAGAMAQGSPVAVFLSPTRELALQTHKEVEGLIRGQKPQLNAMVLYGGENITLQIQPIHEKNVDILSATPGRLVDIIDTGKMSLMYAQTLVLDEADQMLNLGMDQFVAEILTGRDLPDKGSRQTLLFSATFPKAIKDLCAFVTRDGIHHAEIKVGKYDGDSGGSCKNISQIVRQVWTEDERQKYLVQDLQQHWATQEGQVVIFSNRIVQATTVHNALRSRYGALVGHLHGRQDQKTREDVVDRFRRKEYKLLVATNIASRGLDFPDIRLVINYDFPKDLDSYTHRIGRTGRGGQKGVAVTYFEEKKDAERAGDYVKFLELNSQTVPQWLRDMVLTKDELVQRARRVNIPCKYYAMGRCSYPDCAYMHIDDPRAGKSRGKGKGGDYRGRDDRRDRDRDRSDRGGRDRW